MPMSYNEWTASMEYRYDVMPYGWFDYATRRDMYEQYVEEDNAWHMENDNEQD